MIDQIDNTDEADRNVMRDLATALIPEPYLSAYKETSNHKANIMNSRWVGCIYCLLVYAPKSSMQWADGGRTASCPICGVVAVMPLSVERFDSDFLERMRAHWFGNPKTEAFFRTADAKSAK